MTKYVSFQQIIKDQLNVPVQLLTSYVKLGLTETDMVLILQIHRFALENNNFPTPDELSAHLSIDEKECANILRKLIQKDLLLIEQLKNSKNQLTEAYSLNPLWEKLFKEEEVEERHEDGTIFILFEQEFGRPLSPFEIETINTWLDQDELPASLIKAGLRESVLMGKLNFKYIDRILREWKKKGIHTVEQAREASKSFHSATRGPKEQTKKRDTSFYYNWLEGED
ncbi:DnaD domain-containing protein [Virgibacillus sp. SK37]|uniref:DnaD domain-containing protein n=1 Tax=Virgibacillus sp. SK37 TaxID=403957 RepID=UPI0004D1E8B6|nr:DnaD domain-containing protein [Virgibacillus sp. SK37]AIF43597.1 chromosome replication initiation protein DnaD [Virgibacillus sp. SK37]